MRIFFSSDTHYFHKNIIKYCSRPFSTVKEMNDVMVESWNSVVSDEDLAFHVGDFSLSRSTSSQDVSSIIQSLKGRKVLIRGNHDSYDDNFFLGSGFMATLDSINLGGVLLIHYPLHEAFSRKVRDSHWGEVSHVVHGHDHRKDIPEFENHFNVAVDRHNFIPVASDRAIPPGLHDSFISAAKKAFLR